LSLLDALRLGARPQFRHGKLAFERLVPPLALVVLALGLLVPFVLLGENARRGHVSGWDTTIWRFLHGHEQAARGSIVDRAANVVVDIGGDALALLLGLVILAILLGRRRTRDALFLVATSSAILIVTPLLKDVFAQTGLKYSFPSGHAARSATLAATVILIAWPTRYRWPTFVVGTLFTATTGVALVYEDWHLPSDVLGGWCLGIACAGITRRIMVRSRDRAAALPLPPTRRSTRAQ
jgi:membrane-associated phospholipid phosphatase